jgi:hypothetical protein
MGLSGTLPKYKFKDVKETPEVLVVKQKLKEVAAYLCVAKSLCYDVYTYLHQDAFKLGLGPFNGREEFFDLDVQTTTVINGVTYTSSKKQQVKSWTLESAYARMVYNATGNLPLPTPVEVEDTPEVQAYRAQIMAAVQSGIDHGRFKRALAQEFLPILGLPPLPEKKKYTFRIELAPPPADLLYVNYAGEGFTEEEALAAAQERFSADERHITRGYRDYGTLPNFAGLKAAEGATLQLDPKIAPRAVTNSW